MKDEVREVGERPEYVEHVGLSVEEAQGLVDGQFERDQWNGLEQWECVWCKWDTLEGLEAAREHRRQCSRCGPASVVSERVVLVADRRGRQVTSDG